MVWLLRTLLVVMVLCVQYHTQVPTVHVEQEYSILILIPRYCKIANIKYCNMMLFGLLYIHTCTWIEQVFNTYLGTPGTPLLLQYNSTQLFNSQHATRVPGGSMLPTVGSMLAAIPGIAILQKQLFPCSTRVLPRPVPTVAFARLN